MQRAFPARHRFGARAAFALFVLALWLFGLSRLLTAHGLVTVTLPVRAAEPTTVHDLASWRFGPTLVASSYWRDPLSQHHPMFLVDERPFPTGVEKWSSALDDRHPWVEVRWREPHELARVVLRHAGEFESSDLTLTGFTITCLRDAEPGPRVAVTGNHASVTVHPLACANARGVRVEATEMPDGVARLYEIEAWGR